MWRAATAKTRHPSKPGWNVCACLAQADRKATTKARDTIRDLTRPSRCFMPVTQMIRQINQWSTGWTNYFGYGYPRVAFRAMHSFIVKRLTNHLRRRSQRAYCPPVGKSFYAHVHDLGLKRM